MTEEAYTKLQVACNNAYDTNPDSCSHSVTAVIRKIVDPNEAYRQANSMIDYLSANWKEVDLATAKTLANGGVVVIGGLKGEPNGHVIVVYPGDEALNGGYTYLNKKLKKTMTLRQTKKYPLCMSTSKGAWPGAKSKGDKTVWDPWANDEVFAKVKFWTLAK